MSFVTRLSCLSFVAILGCSTHVAGTPTGGDDGSGPDAGPEAGADAAPGLCTAGTSQIAVEPVGPTIQLVVDQSGSMHARLGNVSRWAAMRAALVDPQHGVVTDLDDRVYFGLTLFHGRTHWGGGACVTAESRAPALDARDQVAALLDAADPSGDTPTAATLGQVSGELTPAAPGSRRFMLLATDGFPDNCQNPDAHNLYSQQLTEDAVEAAYAAGIETLVLGIGHECSERHLQRMANAGAGQPLSVGTAPYYVALEPQELASALDALIGSALPTCSFRLDRTLTPAEAAAGSLELDGQPLLYGTDWELVAADTIELLGGACEAALAGPIALTGEFPCDG